MNNSMSPEQRLEHYRTRRTSLSQTVNFLEIEIKRFKDIGLNVTALEAAIKHTEEALSLVESCIRTLHTSGGAK